MNSEMQIEYDYIDGIINQLSEKKALLDSLLKTISLLHTKILVIYYLIINGEIGKPFWHHLKNIKF